MHLPIFDVLWDMGQMHYAICKFGLLFPYNHALINVDPAYGKKSFRNFAAFGNVIYEMLLMLFRPQSVHYSDATMGAMASQIINVSIAYSTFCSCADKRKQQSSASLAFVRGTHRGPVNSPHKWSVTRKMFPFNDVVM